MRGGGCPITRALVERGDIELGVGRGVAPRLDNGVEVWLAGSTAHGSNRGMGDVHARVRCLQHRSGVQAAGVVRMEANGDADLLSQSADELEGGMRLAASGRVFNGLKKVRTR